MKSLLLVLSLLISVQVSADTKFGVVGSLLYNVPEVEGDGGFDSVEEESVMSFGAGFRALMGLGDQLHFRSGAGVVQKKATLDVEVGVFGGDAEFSYTYLNFPATLYWKASPQVGIFGGTSIYALVSDDCDGSGDIDCEADDTKTIVLPLVFGFEFNFSDNMSVELSYEYGMTETADDLKISSAVASFVYYFQ